MQGVGSLTSTANESVLSPVVKWDVITESNRNRLSPVSMNREKQIL